MTRLERFLLIELEEKIRLLIRSEPSEEFINLADFLDYNENLDELNSHLIEISKQTILFWEEYNKYKPYIKLLYDLSSKITGLSNKVTQIWNVLRNEHHYFAINEYLKMSIFYAYLRNQSFTSGSLLKIRERVITRYYSHFDDIEKLTD